LLFRSNPCELNLAEHEDDITRFEEEEPQTESVTSEEVEETEEVLKSLTSIDEIEFYLKKSEIWDLVVRGTISVDEARRMIEQIDSAMLQQAAHAKTERRSRKKR